MTKDAQAGHPRWPRRAIPMLGMLAMVAVLTLTAGVALGQEGLELDQVSYGELDADLDGLNDTVVVTASINNTNDTRSWVFALEVVLTLGDVEVDLESANGRLDPDTTTQEMLSVGTLSSSSIGDYDVEVVLHATDLNGDIEGEDTATFHLYPLGDYELDVDVDPPSTEALENTTVSFTITVTSLSNNPTDVEVNMTSTLGWTFVLDPTTVTLAPDGHANVELTVQVPPNALPGSREDLEIEAVSLRNRSAFATNLTTIMVPMQEFDLTLDINPQNIQIATGETVDVEGVVRNLGNNLDNVSLLAGLPPGWVAEFDPPHLLLTRGGTSGFVMHLTAPGDLTEAGTLDVNITARSEGLVEEAERTLTVVYNTAELVIDGGNVTITPPVPAVGEMVTLQAGVKNSGAVDADGVTVIITTDGGEVARTTVASLPPGGLGVATLTWVPTPGTSLLRVIVDPANEVPEMNETNNEHQVTLVVASPDLTVSRGNVSLDPEYPTEGSAVKVLVTVRNEASLPAGPFQVVIEVNEEVLENFTVEDGLVGGDSVTLEAIWTAVGGKHTFSVLVDPDGHVTEEDKGDNQVTRQFTVNGRPLANLTAKKDKVSVDEALELDGSRSQDLDGRVRQWFFDYGDGTDSGWVFTPIINHTYTKTGEYEVRLYVRDEGGAQSENPAVVDVTVEDRSSTEERTPGPSIWAALMALAVVAAMGAARARSARGWG